jgi:tRNA-dihydrouridine synthase C
LGLQNGKPLIHLAPMEGVLDWTLRELLSEIGGVDRMVTEFVRVTDKLLPDHVFHKYCPELGQHGRTRSGTPVFVQLLGGQAGPLAENAARVADLGAPGIDLNFGCPAKTVNRHDGGATLLKEPERLFRILSAVRAAVPAHKPVTAKVRLGFDHKDFHREIADAVERGGAAHIVVHARTKAEMYTPPAHWSYIRSMREGRDLPFLANGEIWSVEDYWECVAASGVSDVALGRGLVRRPTLALEIRASVLFRASGVGHLPIAFDQLAFLKRFFSETLAFRGGQYTVARMKQILRYWSLGDSRAKIWFDRIKLMRESNEIGSFFEEESLCQHPYRSTLHPAAPTASSQKTF